MKSLKCPICKKTIRKEGNGYFPFCGKQCKLADLHSWLSGTYKISRPIKDNKENEKDG